MLKEHLSKVEDMLKKHARHHYSIDDKIPLPIKSLSLLAILLSSFHKSQKQILGIVQQHGSKIKKGTHLTQRRWWTKYSLSAMFTPILRD